MNNNKSKEKLNFNQQADAPWPLSDTDVMPPSRFGINRRKAAKSLDAAYKNGVHFTDQEGFNPIRGAVLVPSEQVSADLRKKVDSAPEVFHLPQDKHLQEDLYEAKKQLNAEELMGAVADKLSIYTSEEESGSVVFSLRETEQIQARHPDVGIPRGMQGDLRSGIDTHNVDMEAKWSMNGQIVALGYIEEKFFLPDEEVRPQANFSKKLQVVLDFRNNVMLYGGLEDGEGLPSVHKITSFLKNPNTRIVDLDESDVS